MMNSPKRVQGADEQVIALVANARQWLQAMRCFGRVVHRAGPLGRSVR